MISKSSLLQFSIGTLLVAIINLITIPIIAWNYEQVDVGKISLLITITSFTTLVLSLGLDQWYIREYYNFECKSKIFKHSISIAILSLLLFLSLLGFVGFEELSDIVFSIKSDEIGFCIILCISFSLISRLLSVTLRMNEQGILYSTSQVLPKIIFLISTITMPIAFVDVNIKHLVLSQSFAISTTFVCLVFINRKIIKKSIKQRVDTSLIVPSLKFSVPLMLGGVAYWCLTATDKIFLKILSSYEELGLYSVLVSISGAALIIQNIFSIVWTPTVYKLHSSGENFEKVDGVRSILIFIIFVVFCLVGSMCWVLEIVLPEEYQSIQYMICIAISSPLLYTISETTVIGLGIKRKTKHIMVSSMIAMLFNVSINLILIPKLGALGATISTSLSFFVLLVLRTEFSNIMWMNIKRRKMYISMFICVSFSITNAISNEYYKVYFNKLWTLLLIASIYWFRDEIKLLYNITKGK